MKILDEFKELVGISSPTGDERRMADTLKQKRSSMLWSSPANWWKGSLWHTQRHERFLQKMFLTKLSPESMIMGVRENRTLGA